MASFLELAKEFTFEASHILPKHPGKCSRLHGHSWKLIVTVKGEVNPETGFVMDYADLKAKVQPLIDELDHKHLGSRLHIPSDWCAPCVAGRDFYPSSENLITWIGQRLWEMGLVWHKLVLNETCTSACTLYWSEFNR